MASIRYRDPVLTFLLTREGVSLDPSSHATVCVSKVRYEGWEDFQVSQVVFTSASQHQPELHSREGGGGVDEVFSGTSGSFGMIAVPEPYGEGGRFSGPLGLMTSVPEPQEGGKARVGAQIFRIFIVSILASTTSERGKDF